MTRARALAAGLLVAGLAFARGPLPQEQRPDAARIASLLRAAESGAAESGAAEALAEAVHHAPHAATAFVFDRLRAAGANAGAAGPALSDAEEVARLLERDGRSAAIESFERAVVRDAEGWEEARHFEAAFTAAVASLQRDELQRALDALAVARRHADALAAPELVVAAHALGAELHARLDEPAAHRRSLAEHAELARELGLSVEAVHSLRSLADLELARGELHAATQRYEEALVLARDLEDAALEARVLARLATLDSALGHYGSALRLLEASLAAWERAGDAEGWRRTNLTLAGVYSEVGLTEEALARIEADAEHAPGHTRNEEETAELSLTRGLVLFDAGRHPEALEALRHASALFETRADTWGIAESARQEGATLLALGRAAEAEPAFRRAEALLADSGVPLQLALARTGRGYALAAGGRWEEAEAAWQSALDAARASAGNEAAWRARLGLSRAAEVAGDPERAEEHLSAVVARLDAIRGHLEAPALRARYLGDKLEAFRRGARLAGRAGRVDEGFVRAEGAKARTLLELTAHVPREALARPNGPLARDGTAAELRASEQRLVRLERALSRARRGPAQVRLRSELDAARTAHDRVRLSTELADRRGAALAGLVEPALVEVAAALGPAEVLVEFVVEDDAACAFVVTADGDRFLELPAGGRQLETLVDRLLGPIEELGEGRTDLLHVRFDTRAAEALHELLVVPFAEELAHAAVLWVVPDGPLWRLPFGLLVSERTARPVDPGRAYAQYEGCRFLVEEIAVGTLPTAGLLLGAPDASQDADRLLAVVADPRPLPDGSPALPHARLEAQGVAAAAGSSLSLLGEDACEADVKEVLRRASVVHLATHGMLVDERPAYSRLALAAGSPGPGAAEEDGWLHAFELEPGAVGARHIVLSACRTVTPAREESSTGEGLLGLARSFLIGGARSVVANAWVVDDEATAELMQRYHGSLAAGEAPLQALRSAQRAILAGGRDGLSYAHPLFWAGFLHIGR